MIRIICESCGEYIDEPSDEDALCPICGELVYQY